MVPESCDDSMNRSSSQQHHLQHKSVVTQEIQNIVTGQTTTTKGDTEILSKDFSPEGKIEMPVILFLNPVGSPGKTSFPQKMFSNTSLYLFFYFKEAIRKP